MSIAPLSRKFWINAFIPQFIQGYTRPIPGSGALTMIPGPNVPFAGAEARLQVEGRGVRPGVAPIELTVFAYHTDQRTFSNDIHASARMHSEVRVDLRSAPPAITQWHNCDESVECDAMTGRVLSRRRGNTSRMSFRLVPASPDDVVSVAFQCAANNPCSASSSIAGDIDCVGKVSYDRQSRTLDLDAKIDDFPAFEAYATLNDGAGVALFRISPLPGNTVMNLPGPPRRSVRFRLQDRNGDAIFDTLTPF